MHIELTEREAFFLRMVLDRVSGSTTESARKYTQSVIDKLIEKGVPYDDDYMLLHGELTFE